MSNEDHFLTSHFLLLTIAATLQLNLDCQTDSVKEVCYIPPNVILNSYFCEC